MNNQSTQPNRVLVTGGSGFVGANLIRLLLDKNIEVTIYDNFSVIDDRYLKDLPLQIIQGDILDANHIADAVKGHDAIVHLAAQTGVPGSIQHPLYDCQVNVLGTLNLLEAARHNDVKRFVFASSNAPLGKQPPPATEDKAPLPISPYGASKLAGEGYCLAYHGSWGLGTVVLRFANLYGPCSAHKNSVVAKFIKDIAAGKPLTIHGDGQQTRDFIYVGDLCQAVYSSLCSDISGEVFQIATGVETSIATLLGYLQQITGAVTSVSHADFRRGDIRQNFSSIHKANQLLGWEPQVSIQSGLESTWNWFQKSS